VRLALVGIKKGLVLLRDGQLAGPEPPSRSIFHAIRDPRSARRRPVPASTTRPAAALCTPRSTAARPAATLRAALRALLVADLLLDARGALRPVVDVYVDGADGRPALDEPLPPAATVRVVAATANGAGSPSSCRRDEGWPGIRPHDVSGFAGTRT
jgi:hypothetical protein